MNGSLHPYFERVATLVTPDLLAAGRALLEAGAVLDASRPSRRVVAARVANERGRFEEVRVSFTKAGVTSSCSCGRSRFLCAHAVALLLQFCAAEDPMLEQLPSPDPVRTTGSRPGEAAAPEPERNEWTGPAPDAEVHAGRGSLRTLAGGGENSPQLFLRLPAPLPGLDTRWSRIEIECWLELRGRRYEAANVRRLVDMGQAAGQMTWDELPLQERQIMRFLVAHGDAAAGGFSVSAPALCDLFQLLRGFPRVSLGQAPLTLHTEPVELVLALHDTGPKQVSVCPGVRVPGVGILPPDGGVGVVGENGYWIGWGEHFWWLPGILDGFWFRCFLRGQAETMSAAECRALQAAVTRSGMPVSLVVGTTETATPTVVTPCVPRLALDWLDGSVLAELAFQYDDDVLPAPPAAGTRISGGAVLVRQTEDERAAEAVLLQQGFQAVPRPSGAVVYRLALAAGLWTFLRQGMDLLPPAWNVFMSASLLRARAAAGVVRVEVLPASESGSWFELDCRFRTERGLTLDWKDVVALAAAGQDTAVLRDGTVVHVPQDVLDLIRKLQSEAQAGEEGRLRFARYSAAAVAGALGDEIKGFQADWTRLARRLLQPPTGDLALPNAALDQVLRGYQKEGVAWMRMLEECAFHGILADEMGLGKTVQALAVMDWRKRCRTRHQPSLVICPSSLLDNWRNEARRFSPDLQTLLVRGLHRAPLLNQVVDHDLIITSYALLRRDIRFYRGVEFDYVVLDEAQHIKNPQTANARTCKQLNAEHRLILTGTPLENSLHEVWSLFDFLLPGYLGLRQEFQSRYEQAEGRPAEAAVRRDLAVRIRPFVLRRRKADVCQELPPKIEQELFCEMDERQWRLYTTFLLAGRELLAQAKSQGWRRGRFQVLAVLTRLRQICCHPQLLPENLREGHAGVSSAKTDLLQEVILEAIDSGRRVLLFSQFTSFLKIFRTWLDGEKIAYEYLDGSTPDRQDRVDRFNRDAGIPIFLLSLRAGGTGLNLTGADMVIHYDQWWNPMVEDQATDRAHRIGQVKQVTSLKLMVRNTIEEKVLQLQGRKRQLFTDLISGVPTRAGELNPEDVEFLLAAN